MARQAKRGSTSDTPDVQGLEADERADIRLLGRLLGDTIREQCGQAMFDKTEEIRQSSVRFHRDGGDDAELTHLLDSLSLDDVRTTAAAAPHAKAWMAAAGWPRCLPPAVPTVQHLLLSPGLR